MGYMLKMLPMKKHGFGHYVMTIFYQLLKGSLLALIGVIIVWMGFISYNSQASPLNLIIGIPLTFGGAGLTINFLLSIILTIFSPAYNRGVCNICNTD